MLSQANGTLKWCLAFSIGNSKLLMLKYWVQARHAVKGLTQASEEGTEISFPVFLNITN